MIFFVIFTVIVYVVNTVMVIVAIKEDVMSVALSIVSLVLPFVFTVVFVWGMIGVHKRYMLEYLKNSEGRLGSDESIIFNEQSQQKEKKDE